METIYINFPILYGWKVATFKWDSPRPTGMIRPSMTSQVSQAKNKNVFGKNEENKDSKYHLTA